MKSQDLIWKSLVRSDLNRNNRQDHSGGWKRGYPHFAARGRGADDEGLWNDVGQVRTMRDS